MDAGVEIGEGQGSPREEETVPLISLTSAARTGCNPPPFSKNIHKVSPQLLGNLAKGLMHITLLGAQHQNPGPVPALELLGLH